MNAVIMIAALLIVLGIVVFVHEVGHLLAARWAGARVDAFSIGFGPAIVKWHDKRGTLWKISILPLGGYCSIYGREDMFDRKKYAELPDSEKKGHYLSAPAWKQALIVAGGVIMNFVLAWGIYTAMLAIKPRVIQLPVVAQVVQSSPAYDAGVQPGDTIARINGNRISNWGDIILAKELSRGHDADMVLIRGDSLVQVKISSDNEWGLVADGTKKELQKKNILQAAYGGARETWVQSKTIVLILKQIIVGERSSKQLGSFITIAKISGKALAESTFALLSIIALLSVNLAIINLLPLPVLDGGYLLILGVEGVIRRKLQGRGMEFVLIFGWILIGLLFAFTIWNDIARMLGWN